MTRIVKVKHMSAYVWDCPGCGESNLDSIPERLKIHDACNMDYISVKCSACNASYVVEGSHGWLTQRRRKQGKSAERLKKHGSILPNQIKYTREELTRREANIAQCYLCGGHGACAAKIIHDTRCAFSDPTVDHVYVGGRL